MRGWQGYPSEKSWFSIHFPWVNHTLYYTGAPECPVVLGHNLHFATLDLCKRKTTCWHSWHGGKHYPLLGGGVSTVPRSGVCNSNQNILTLSFFPAETLSCVSPADWEISAWLWEQGWEGIGAGLWIPEWCKELSLLLHCFALLLLLSTELSCVYFQLFGGYEMRCSFSLFQASLPLKLIFLLL